MSITNKTKLTIPKHWTNVQIFDKNSHVLAKGISIETGKIQYIYNPEFTDKQNRAKFDRMILFSKKIDSLHNAIKNIKQDINSQNFIISLIIRIIYKTFMRIGNEQYDTYGITTLEKRHIFFKDDKIIFDFVGKKNVHHIIELKDPFIYKYLYKIVSIKKPNDRIFDPVTSEDVNQFIKKYMGQQFSSKDFRTYASNRLFIEMLRQCDHKNLDTDIRKAITFVANELGHTKNTSKKSYIMNSLIDLYKKDPYNF